MFHARPSIVLGPIPSVARSHARRTFEARQSLMLSLSSPPNTKLMSGQSPCLMFSLAWPPRLLLGEVKIKSNALMFGGGEVVAGEGRCDGAGCCW
ncbi:hypothetical protein Droror1_Dr00016476 [Drosera rotundifolia]